MTTFHRYRHPAPKGSLVVKIVSSGGEPFGFLREVPDRDEEDALYPTEQTPIDHVLRLVDSHLAADPEVQVFVDLEPGLSWDNHWGTLD
jgi:hypothetical protein